MKRQVIYSGNELTTGICISCGEKSDEILIEDGRCIDCIEEEYFIEMTQKKINHQANHKSPFGIW